MNKKTAELIVSQNSHGYCDVDVYIRDGEAEWLYQVSKDLESGDITQAGPRYAATKDDDFDDRRLRPIPDEVAVAMSAVYQEAVDLINKTIASAKTSEEQPALGWIQAHDDAAAQEGWNIFDCDGSANDRWQLCRIDDVDAFQEAAGFKPPQLASDDDAFLIVANGTQPHHQAARDFLKAHNMKEFTAVMAFDGKALRGEVGKHDWCIGKGSEDGYPVFVDDRQLSYRPTLDTARELAFSIIADLQADGDYRLNDRPAGFNPPKRKQAETQQCTSQNAMAYYVWTDDGSCDNKTSDLTEARKWRDEFIQQGYLGSYITDSDNNIIEEREAPEWFTALQPEQWKQIVLRAGLDWNETMLNRWTEFTEKDQRKLCAAAEIVCRNLADTGGALSATIATDQSGAEWNSTIFLREHHSLQPSGRFITDKLGRKVAEMMQPGDSVSEQETYKRRLVGSFNALPTLFGVLLRADADGKLSNVLYAEGLSDAYEVVFKEALTAMGESGVAEMLQRYELEPSAINTFAEKTGE